MNSRALLALALAAAGCSVGTQPSMREMQALQQAQIAGAGVDMESQMQAVQDMMEGKDTEAARALKQRSEAMARQQQEVDRQMRKDPRYARMREEEEREERRRNPSGVASQFNLSDAEEADLGFGMAQQFLSNQKLVADERVQRYVNQVGMWVAQQSERPGLPWRFAVIEGRSPNAFAIPGGYVFVTLGMFDLIETESELAGILGHEIAHVVRKHHLRWIYLNKEFEVALQQAQQASGGNNPAFRGMLESLGKVMERSKEQMNSTQMRAGVSKSEEFQADTDGAILAWRAGYEAWGLAAVLQRFEAVNRGRQADPDALTDHPEPLQRLKILDLALRWRAEKDTLGDVGGQRFVAAMRVLRERGN